jgi:hypothetical protein
MRSVGNNWARRGYCQCSTAAAILG